eukprot:TRINITY_DN42134_c0_g1_i1.p1 TRINITY_DN42134_c0_g1~~TRINITY_DN42134_c0_g1_i1.p1  ORF type:complete len:433 (+),score=87.38 TRINITY_DN42134_c0_g1_i1:36-1334(+)
MATHAELNARERKHVHMSSSIFDAGGPASASLYAPGRQQELYSQLKETLSYTKRPVDFGLSSPADMKVASNAGSNAAMPSHGYAGAAGLANEKKKDPQFMPKEFWSTSVDLQWHDVRNERCRGKTHGQSRESMDHKAKKMQELSSELFDKARMTEASTNTAKHELMADTDDFMKVDSQLHDRHNPRRTDAKACDRFYANLNNSSHSTMPRHPAMTGEASERSEPAASEVARGSGGQWRNFSDLTGTQMGRREDDAHHREEITATHTCSFLDHRSEIAQRNKDRWRRDEDTPAERREVQGKSKIFGEEGDKRKTEPELQQVINGERGCWESRDWYQTSSEISRRRREKDFAKDFHNSDFTDHIGRKQDEYSSSQVRRNFGTEPAPQADPAMRDTPKLASPLPARLGPKPSEREELLKSAKDTKLASLQSSIFS